MATSMIKSRNGGAPGRNREGLWSPESSLVRAAPSRPWRLRKHMHAGQTLGSGSGHGDEARGKKGMAKGGREPADVTRPIRGGTRNESPKTPRGTPLAHGPPCFSCRRFLRAHAALEHAARGEPKRSSKFGARRSSGHARRPKAIECPRKPQGP